MRLLLQRVSRARVDIGGETAGPITVGQIGPGLLVLAGFGKGDGMELPGTRTWRALCDKLLDLRIFPDADGKLNLSLKDTAQAGAALVGEAPGPAGEAADPTGVAPDPAGEAAELMGKPPGLLLVSQFTLYADTRRGRRPSFTDAAPPEVALALYDRLRVDLADACAQAGLAFATGRFGAEMHLTFTNWGPVTILLDSDEFEGKG